MSLAGMWCLFDNGEGYYQSGELVKQLTEKYYLVKVSGSNNDYKTTRVISLKMMAVWPQHVFGFLLFSTKQELDDWFAWFDTP